MENVFEGAKFGDKFLTRDGRIIRFIHDNSMDCKASVLVFDETSGYTKRYGNNGIAENKFELCAYDDDIVSRYQEPINDAELDELANNNLKKTQYYESANEFEAIAYIDGYFDGYRKAKEE